MKSGSLLSDGVQSGSIELEVRRSEPELPNESEGATLVHHMPDSWSMPVAVEVGE